MECVLLDNKIYPRTKHQYSKLPKSAKISNKHKTHHSIQLSGIYRKRESDV